MEGPMKEKVLQSILARRRMAALHSKKDADLTQSEPIEARKPKPDAVLRDESRERLKRLAQTASVAGATVNKGG
jgi:hypothetical protein